MKRLISLALRLAISVLLLWFIFRDHRLQNQVLPRLQSLGHYWPWSLAGIVSAGLALLLSACRWWVILRAQVPEVCIRVVLRTTLVSYFFNITSLGTVGGDAYKILALSRHHPSQKIAVMISLVADHLSGLIATVLLFPFLSFVFYTRWSSYSSEIHCLLQVFSAGIMGALVLMILSVFSLSPTMLSWGARKFPRLMRRPAVKQLGMTYDALRKTWPCSILAVPLSIVMIFFFFFSFYCGMRAVGGTAPLLDVLVAMPVVDTVAALPISISGLGVREKTFEALMASFSGLPEAVGVSASLAGWLFSVFLGLIGGIIFLFSHTLKPTTVSEDIAS